MKISIPKELHPLETRVALTPDVVTKLVKAGFGVRVESGAGLRAGYPDADYAKAGAEIVDGADKLWSGSEVLAKIGLPSRAEIDRLPAASLYIGFLNPLADPSLSAALAARQVTALSMELIPRTSRAQSMDALSSQASIAGYKAVLLGASTLGKYFPMLTTAAGTVPPAKVLVIGVGVAGLQAIATARRLGAVVEAFDIRPEVKEQVQSLGAKFVEARVDTSSASADGGYAKEVSEDTKRLLQEALAERVAASDVVITTAQVPGKKAPVLVSAAMTARMKPGAVIVDMAAEQGGNVEGSKAGETVDVNGVRILGPVNLPATLSQHASQLFAKNIQALLALLSKDGKLHLDFADDIVKSACVAHGGVVVNERVKALLAS
jgi:NAD(P) transhydrogenase subunit alpha